MDYGIALARLAADAFGNYIAPRPSVPELTAVDRECLDMYCQALEVMAERLKEKAAEANRLGRVNLGLVLIRAQLSVEETGEWMEAMRDGDIAQAFKELVDMSVVTDGHYLTLGLQELKSAGLREVYTANFTKLVDGKPVISEAGRHVKGPDYRAPDMGRVLREAER